MRIISFFDKKEKKSWKGRLSDAVANSSLKKGLYIITMNTQKKYAGYSDNGLKQTFIELYNGMHMDTDVKRIDIYENRDKIEVYWIEEPSLQAAKDYVTELGNEMNIIWLDV